VNEIYQNDLIQKIAKIAKEQKITTSEFTEILENPDIDVELFKTADKIRREHYGTDVYMRGLIEISNYCKNDCLYCGIRRSNKNAERYRLTREEILKCAENGYKLGFRTFVLQGGEDSYYSDELLCGVIVDIKAEYPDCAVTLSLGERSFESYKALRSAGADRYLLRHETANNAHYQKLHPSEMKLENRKQCLYDLKKLGFQVGAGFMVGSPYQLPENLAEDLQFLAELKPHMVGIGPFISHADTPFKDFQNGDLRTTLICVALTRLLLPSALIPATTALGTIDPKGRELGIKAGANVVMPNLSPLETRSKYLLYDGKICTGDEAAECVACMGRRMNSIGYSLVNSRGDWQEGNFGNMLV
jgi:biotin synthase